MKTRLHKTLGRLFRRKFRESVLSNFGEGVLANTKNGLLVVEAGDFAVGRKLLEKGEYDFDEIQWLRKYLSPEKSNVVVVGSHVGCVLIPISKYCKTVIAFEADVKNYTLLSYNLSLNNCDNITAFNKAIGEKNGSVKIERNLINTGNTSVSTSENKSGNNYSEVEMVTLDNSVDMEYIDLILMDIEGYEPQALAGASNTIDKTSMLYTEFAPEQLSEFNNDPFDMISLLFSKFEYMYVYDTKIQSYNHETCVKWLNKNIDKRGFLCNLLFSKNPLE